MRKRYRVVILAAFVAALAVPVGFALSIESSSAAVVAQASDASIVAASAKSGSIYMPEPTRARGLLPSVPDGAKLLLVGAALFIVASAMRRTY